MNKLTAFALGAVAGFSLGALASSGGSQDDADEMRAQIERAREEAIRKIKEGASSTQANETQGE